MNGILNIYKEAGWTSFDVVAKLRRILKQKKIGHTGTLDPAAEGVLPVCIGKATKLCDFLTDGTKTYEAVLLLGVMTDTLDMEGQVIKTCPVECTEEEIRRCITSFLGEQEQVPPMYSALKVNGKRLYELARQGQVIERKPRRVTFYELEVLDISLPRVRFKITCSKGTYIRSLCDDIGRALNCGGCMESLTRTASGGFKIDETYRLSEIEEIVNNNDLESVLLPMDRALVKYPKVITKKESDKAVRNGRWTPSDSCDYEFSLDDIERVRLYDSENNFIGIFVYSKERDSFIPEKILGL